MILISKSEQELLTEQQKSLVRNLFGENSLRSRTSVEEVGPVLRALELSRRRPLRLCCCCV